MAEASLILADHEEARELFGPQDHFLRLLRDALNIQVVLRGSSVRLLGDAPDVELGARVLREWRSTLRQTGELSEHQVMQILRTFSGEAEQDETTSGSSMPQPHQEVRPVADRGNGSGNTGRRFGSTASWEKDDRQFIRGTATTRPRRMRHSDTGDFGASDLRSRTDPGEHSGGGRLDRIRPKTEGQARYLEAMEHNDLVFCQGPAGCGKTYLAVAMALRMLRNEEVRKIVLVRPAVEAGEKLGFLPGDLLAKVNPFLRPLLDAINDLLDFEAVRRYMSNDIIEVVPLAFMRGRTLNDTYMILDEGQNTTVTQMKMFLTRMGINSRIVVTGDATQNDLPPGTRSGLIDGMERLSGINGVAIATLTAQDIVRHRLVREIVSAYETGDSATGPSVAGD